MGRKTIIYIGLSLIAVLPMILGSLQMIHYICWLLDIDYGNIGMFTLINNSIPFLVFAFVISLLEKFCFYHRLTICATLYANCSCFFLEHYPSILFYNITNLIAVTLIIAGMIGCMIHFSYQLYDFKRYIGIRKSQQAAHQGTL